MDKPKRLDSRLEAEGAEFLVLAHLLIEGVQTIKAYTRFPGFDLIAADPDHGTSCRIQVKSRWATDYDRAFPLSNLATDFVVLVALNRGYRYQRRRAGASGTGKHAPELYVFPIELLRPLVQTSGGWSKVYLRNVPEVETYKDRWDLIKGHLTAGPNGATKAVDATDEVVDIPTTTSFIADAFAVPHMANPITKDVAT